MRDIVKRSARVMRLDEDALVLIKRTKPGREPYWVAVGGGVEESDPTVEAALRREVFEELGGELGRAELVHLISDNLPGGIGVQHIFAARLESADLAERTGTEFLKPERGGHETETSTAFTQSVKEAMGALRVTQAELPLALGLSKSKINYRLTGRTRWTLDDAHNVATYFGVSAVEMMSGPGTGFVAPIKPQFRP